MRKHTNDGIVVVMAGSPDAAPRSISTTGPRLFSEVQANAFLGLIRAGAALERALDRGLADEQGIGLHQFEVLLFLATSSSDRSMPMTELRRRTPLSQSRVSRVVSGLEADGLVRRETDPTDSRAVTVVLTSQGMATFETAQPRHHRDLEEHLFSILNDAEIQELATITTKLLAAEQNQRRERPISKRADGARARRDRATRQA
jgi:DNA-binding MarR family transcriptional regulator